MDHTSLVGSASSTACGIAALRGSNVHAERLGEGENDENKGSVRVVSGSGFRYVVPFPWRLHQMLEDIEKSGEGSIVSWLPDGLHFQVHNPQLFMQRIIPSFFKQKSYKSFQRQLHLYGFQRVLEGPKRGAYFHESFVKEDRKLSLEITRIKAPKRRRTGKTSEKDAKAPECDTTNKQLSMLAKFIPYEHQGAAVSNNSQETSGTVPRQSTHNGNKTYRYLQHDSKRPRLDACVTPPGQDTETPSVAETYEWLINAGVPFSAFDPIAIESQRSCPVSKDGIGSDLFECAAEIKSLFSAPSSPVSSPQWSSQEISQRNDSSCSIDLAASGGSHYSDDILGGLAPIDLQWGI